MNGNGMMNIHILGAHNCESQTTKCISILIDNKIAIDAGSLTSSLSFRAQQELKAILITHCHYDHVRDIPSIAINHSFQDTTINILSTQTVYDAINTHLLNGKLYPEFLGSTEINPAIEFTTIEPYRTEQIEGYDILPIPVNHDSVTVGYQITSPDGKRIFYTADTGPGLSGCWECISPQLLIIEVTFPDKHQEFAIRSGHLTPTLLNAELISFARLNGYLPPVVIVHMNPLLEREIEAEITGVAKNLNTSITLAYEGMQLEL